jgi:hypothetical protein
VLQSTLVPGRANSTSTRPRALLSLSNTCVPLEAGRYHSNDTASSPPPRISAPTKRRCRPLLEELVDDCCWTRLCVLPSLSWNQPSNCQPLTPVTPPTVAQAQFRTHAEGEQSTSPEHSHLLVAAKNSR